MQHTPRFYLAGLAALALFCAAPAMAQVAAPPPPGTATAPTEAAFTATPPAQSTKRLQPLVQKIIDEAGLEAIVCVYVEDADGTVAADVLGTRPVAPASNNKLVTSAAGLTLLGPDFKFLTKFYTTGPVEDGTLNGNLVIYGGGDPGIGARYLKDRRDITAIFRDWAQKLKDSGITRISGSLVADDSYFDDVYFHPNWYPKERAEWYEAEVGALSFNDNCVDIQWSAEGGMPGDPTKFTLHPESDYYTIKSTVVNSAPGRETDRYYDRGASDNNIEVTGTLNAGTKKLDSASIHDPALWTVAVLHDVLTSQGITIGGKPSKDRTAVSKLSDENLLFTHESVPMVQICQTINLNSQNFYTECVAKALGKEKAGEGSYGAARKVIEDFCKNNGIYSEGHEAIDGSGLSHLNRVTCKQLVRVQQFMDKSPLKDQWRSTMPQGQKRGSLVVRFKDVPEAERIFGKTGLIGGVRSLSGWVVDAEGREVYYAIVLNDLPGREAAKGMALIDKLAVELAKSK